MEREMAVYLIIAASLHPTLGQRIESLYPGAQSFSDRAWMIESEETAQSIARKLGISAPDESGKTTSEFGYLLVTKMSGTYWGYGPTSLWDWLKSALQRGS